MSIGFSRQEYWSGLPFPSSGDLPDPGTELTSTLASRFCTTESIREALKVQGASTNYYNSDGNNQRIRGIKICQVAKTVSVY